MPYRSLADSTALPHNRRVGKLLQTVVETPPYLAQAKGVLSEDDRSGIVDMIATDPTCGVVMEGSGGARKARFAIGNKGKSGGVRVVYAYHSAFFPAFLLAVFAKNERSTLSKAETNALAKVIKAIFSDYGENG